LPGPETLTPLAAWELSMPKVAQRYLDVDPWVIRQRGLHPNRARVSEAIFALGNEYMGVRGYFDEGYGGDSLVGSFFNGVYEHIPGPEPMFRGIVTDQTFLANSVDWLHTRISLGRETLDLATSKISGFVRTLDMRTGLMTREFVWNAGGKKLHVTFQRFVSMADPHAAGQRITLEPLNFSGSVKLRVGMDFSNEHEEGDRGTLWRLISSGRKGEVVAGMGKLPGSGFRVFTSYRLECSQPIEPKPADDDGVVGDELTLKLRQGRPTTLDRLFCHYKEKSNRKTDAAVWQRGMDLAAKRAKLAYDEAAEKSVAYWLDVWGSLDVTIEGDPANQQGIRFCIFNMHQTYHGVDPANNVTAKGLTGENYWGVAWWDTETYCLPFYLFNNPRAAKNLLAYRYRTLGGAIRRARQLDFRGARYPMCTIDGDEVCGVWQHGDLEIHVSAAVAYGIRQYDRLIGDKEFLYSKGVEMLLQISRYYASRGEWSPLTREFGFWRVMGADEFHMMAHNNCYKNVMAAKAMQYTLDVMAEMPKARVA